MGSRLSRRLCRHELGRAMPESGMQAISHQPPVTFTRSLFFLQPIKENMHDH